MTIYVSGAMTGIENYNHPRFNAAAARLRAAGMDVTNPAEYPFVDGWEWADYMKRDIILLMQCDSIYMLEGWSDSNGARIERKLAMDLGFKVYYENPKAEAFKEGTAKI